ncbi:aldo/keto reductase [Paenibacillus durus]|uniref:Aldo/keto reductase n=1 Tax=Paenibacillus durus ATCC 35681 TaxID=1333534 RepID=A0A0F7F9W0_PAEDU|nr:aldo/keto reductase [Paenibacillus durus]AKG34927.1 aldo/keto reductase [Paenibacillus durus ATCC 35681]
MLYRKYGKTNEMVSVLGFGCMRLPVIDGNARNIDDDKAIAMLRYGIDNGINYVDTAYPYHGDGMGGPGESEPFVARALKDGYRDKVNIATKLPSWLIKTREDMDRYLNEQLERLETDHIDFYLVHALNAGTWKTVKELGIGEFLDSAVKDGRIRYPGFSFHDELPVFKEIVDAYDWTFCQVQYNYLDEYFQAGIEGLEYAAAKGIGIAVMEPLRGGRLVRDIPDGVQAAFDKADIKRTPAEWALRWVWNNPDVAVTLSGMSTMEQVEENLKIANEAYSGSLSKQELDVVNEARNVFRQTRVSCTGCAYCMPCPAGVNIPGNFTYVNEYYLLDNDFQKKMLKETYAARISEKERASQCVECGTCEEHCPQNLPIIEELKHVAEVFA